MSWPVSSSMMIEPTESENINELNRFIGSLKNIKQDINRLYQIKNNYSENIDKYSDKFNQSIFDEYKNLIDIFKNAPHPINKDNEIDNIDKNYYPSISKVDDKKGDVEILNRFLKKK
jgi:glycine dehydrogenase